MRSVEEIKEDIELYESGIIPTDMAAQEFPKLIDELCIALTADIPLDRLEALCTAEKDGRVVVLPEGYEYASKFYHTVYMPRWCNEDCGCEKNADVMCPYMDGDECRFKPHVVSVSAKTVFEALYNLRGVKLTREEAAAALKGEAE